MRMAFRAATFAGAALVIALGACSSESTNTPSNGASGGSSGSDGAAGSRGAPTATVVCDSVPDCKVPAGFCCKDGTIGCLQSGVQCGGTHITCDGADDCGPS